MTRKTEHEPPPDGLTPAQGALWRDLEAQRRSSDTRGVWSAAAAVGLRHIVDVLARIDQVREAIDKSGVEVAGSEGQMRAHPLMRVEAALRAEFRSAMAEWRRGDV